MKDIKENVKGITLMILVVTIIILLILSTVVVKLSLDDRGVLSEAKEAVNEWNRVSSDEESQLSKLANEMRKIRNGTVDDNEKPGESINNPLKDITVNRTQNIQTKDKEGNKIVILAGFKVVNPEDDVTKGIVVEDVSANDQTSKGNQYVWIPVTHVNGEKINTVRDNNGIECTIELARYEFNTDGTIKTKVIDGGFIASNYLEETEAEHIASGKTNTIAKDINKFKESVKNNGGYYLARYEAGDSTTENERTSSSSQTVTPVFKDNNIVYTNITQPNAATLMRNLYSNQNENYMSDLVNSYAWDTAIKFIQEFSDSNYSNQSPRQTTLAKTGQAINGTNKDIRCNIYDMAGNVSEFSTESNTYKNFNTLSVPRGGNYSITSYSTIHRGGDNVSNKFGSLGFRRNFIYAIILITNKSKSST